MLDQLNLKVDATNDPEQVQNKLLAQQENEPYSTLLIDWKMPGLDGLELAQAIQENPAIQPKPRCILVTAYGHHPPQQKDLRKYFETILLKPVNESILLNALTEIYSESDFLPKAADSPTRNPFRDPTEKLKGSRVLLAEDNLINRQVANELLTLLSIEVTEVENGQAAIEAMKAQPEAFDLILMDVQMPIMDGYQATRSIRENKQWDNIPILAMTAHAMAEDIERCLDAGLNDHVSKPVDPEDLQEKLLYWKEKRDQKNIEKAAPVANTSASKTHSDPAQIKLFDSDSALARLNQNQALYRKLLVDFLKEQAETESEILASIQKEAWSTAARTIHTLKGIAGNLGCNRLFHQCREMESLLHSKSVNTPSFFRTLEQTLGKTRSAVEAYLQEEKASPQPDAHSPSNNPHGNHQIHTLIGLLEKRIEASSLDVEEPAQELRDLLKNSDSDQKADHLLESLENFDFESAHQLIAEIKRSFG